LCPVCNEPLIALELKGVELDYCPSCHGMWLDAGELEQIAELAEVPAGPLSAALQKAVRGIRSRRRCPRCRRKMATAVVAGDPPVEIDRCLLGHGLWLDAGELRTLVSSFSEGEVGAVAALFRDLLRDEFDADLSRG
jgi:Zn-finger nucleic acid-binding protein